MDDSRGFGGGFGFGEEWIWIIIIIVVIFCIFPGCLGGKGFCK